MTRPPPTNERFLSRWSRLKRAQAASADVARVAPPVSSPTAAPPSTATPAVHAATEGAAPVTHGARGEGAAPVLPSIESLTMESDYGQFFQSKVPESLRRAAVKKLFADPHFNVMDGLDTYIDDYTKSDPIPPEMLALMHHARDIIDHPSNRKPEPVAPAPVAPQEAQGPQESEGQPAGAAVDAPEVPAAAAPEHALGSAGQPAATPSEEPDTPFSTDAAGAADLPARPPGTAA